MREGASLEWQGMPVPAIQLSELLEELAQLEADSAGKPDPLDVSLLDRESAPNLFFMRVGVFAVLERSDLGTGAVVREEDLGPRERIEIRDDRD